LTEAESFSHFLYRIVFGDIGDMNFVRKILCVMFTSFFPIYIIGYFWRPFTFLLIPWFILFLLWSIHITLEEEKGLEA